MPGQANIISSKKQYYQQNVNIWVRLGMATLVKQEVDIKQLPL